MHSLAQETDKIESAITIVLNREDLTVMFQKYWNTMKLSIIEDLG